MRWILVVLLAVSTVAVVVGLVLPDGTEQRLVVLPESEMPGRLLVGFHDDASLRFGAERAEMLDRAREAGASVIRTILVWQAAAPRAPADPANPFDPAYGLDDLDELARNAQQRGIELLITIWGTPAWANGGQKPNRPPTDERDLEAFAQAIADRYSGRHPGYPAVRLFSVWNEPNLEQFLAPQFDAAGRSVAPALYAPLARAVYRGVKRANPGALVAIGETSPRGRDLPTHGSAQDSHSPARFARLLSEERPRIPFDAWAKHPYPTRPDVGPVEPVRWPRVGLANLERFGESLDLWFGREGTPLWVTEYGHETDPDRLGVPLEQQAAFAREAVALTVRNPRVRAFVWFILRDIPQSAWQSGLIAEDGSPKPAFATFSETARRLDARNPVLPEDAAVARVPALELAFHTPAGAPIEVSISGAPAFEVPLGQDGWLEVPLEPHAGDRLRLRVTNEHGHSVVRNVRRAAPGLELR